jgi:NDP-sugar pyrophosphorylase family protein
MQAVVLAGGLGTRLKPITERTPKVMALANGRPFLSYLLELLKTKGVEDVILCIGYLGDQIENAFGKGDELGIRIRYSREEIKLLGTGGAVKQAQHLLDDYFYVINGDTYLPINYQEVQRTFIRSGKEALVIVYDNRENTGVKNNVELDSNLMVIRYDKGSCDVGLKYVEAGVSILKHEVLDLIEERCSVSLEKELYLTLIERKELVACVTKQRFYDIGTPEQLRVFEEYLKEKQR